VQKKQFLSNLLFIQILNVLIKAFWILWIDREIQNYLPSDSYGQYYSILGFSILFIILLDAGINNFNSREVAQNNAFFHQNFVGIIATKLLLSLVYVAIAVSVALVLQFDSKDMYVLALLLVFQIIASLNLYLRSNIAAHQEFKLDGILGVLDRLLVILLCGLMLYHSAFKDYLNIQNFILAQIIGVATTFMVAFYLNIQRIEKLNWSINFKLIINIVKQAFPYALLIILMGLFTRMDVVMLKALLSDHIQADHYAKGYRLLDAANMFAMLLSGMLLPLFSKMIREQKNLNEIVRLSAKVMLLPALPFVLIMVLHSGEVMQLLYPAKYEASLDAVFQYITISFFGYALVYIFGTLLTAKADLKFLNTAAAATAMLNISLNLFWIPKEGAFGAAKATLISQSVFAILCYLRARSVFNFSMEKKEFFRYLISIVSVILLIVLSKQLFDNAVVHMLLSVVATFIIYSIAKIFRPAELLQLLKR